MNPSDERESKILLFSYNSPLLQTESLYIFYRMPRLMVSPYNRKSGRGQVRTGFFREISLSAKNMVHLSCATNIRLSVANPFAFAKPINSFCNSSERDFVRDSIQRYSLVSPQTKT